MKAARPHELAMVTPPAQLVRALVRNLAEAVGGQAVYGLPSAPIATWPAVVAPADEAARELVAGGAIVAVSGVRRWTEAKQALLRETALWLGIAARLTRLRDDHVRASARAAGLRAEVTSARERLAQVRDLERRRLVGAITTTTLRDLAEVRGLLTESLTDARAALDDLIDNFRTVVRGVYPAMLPERGPVVTLEELAATLPRPVRFDGDLGRRVGWQIESGLYHAVAAVLNVLAGMAETSPIAVHFTRDDDALRVRLTAGADLTADDLRATLAHDAERLAVLGGAMECGVAGGEAVVTVRVSSRIEPTVSGTPPSDNALYRRVLALVRAGQEAAGAAWDVVAERLMAPPLVAVVGNPPAETPPPGVTVVVVPPPANEALAATFVADDGVDAVLCLDPPTPAFRSVLRGGRHRVELSESGSLDRLAHKLVAWHPVLAARRALTTATDLARTLPDSHPVRWEVDRIRAEAHELAELDLLDALESGDPRLLRDLAVDAVRLLGAHGTSPQARLGLPEDASAARIHAAATRAATHWRAQAQSTGGRDRQACEILARTAEGLLGATR